MQRGADGEVLALVLRDRRPEPGDPRQPPRRSAGAAHPPAISTGGSPSSSLRSVSSAERSRRETCICERPTRSAISVWVSPPMKRRRTISRSRGGSVRSALESESRSSAASSRGSETDQRRRPRRRPDLARRRRIERHGIVREPRAQRLQHLLARHPGLGGELLRRRRPAEARRERALGSLDRECALLDRSRQMDGPADVAHVALDLSEDRRDGIAGERRPAVGIEAVDRLHEREAGHLHEILERHRRVAVAAREAAREREVALDQLGPRPLGVVAISQRGEQLVDGGAPSARAARHRRRWVIAQRGGGRHRIAGSNYGRSGRRRERPRTPVRGVGSAAARRARRIGEAARVRAAYAASRPIEPGVVAGGRTSHRVRGRPPPPRCT